MSNPMELAIVHINNYIWDLVSGSISGLPAAPSAVWNASNYTYKPFYPVTESLAPDSTIMPFVIYDYMLLPKAGTFWPIQKEEAEYCIVGDLPNIFYVKNYIVDALEKFDESARDINNYLINSGATVNFKYITVDQENYIADEKRIDSFKPKFITCLKLTYEYTK